MSRIADARNVLLAALEPVLPGRVEPYPLEGSGRLLAPRVSIGVADTNPATLGSYTGVTEATFPVLVSYDGAVRAQVAGLDDLLSSVIDAVNAAPGFQCDGSRSNTRVDGPDTTVRACVVLATTTIAARTLCPPEMTSTSIPPELTLTGGGRHG